MPQGALPTRPASTSSAESTAAYREIGSVNENVLPCPTSVR